MSTPESSSHSAPAQPSPPETPHGLARFGGFRLGFVTTLGVLLALALGSAILVLKVPLTLVFAALFVTLGLDPLIRWIEGRGVSRPLAIFITAIAFLAVCGLVVWMVVPVIIEQANRFIQAIPTNFNEIESQPWFETLNANSSGAAQNVLGAIEQALADPNVWIGVGGGILQIGQQVVTSIVNAIFVVILTLYFMASLDSMKQGLSSLIPASKRDGFIPISEEINRSVGKYLSGMVILAFMNAVFSFIVMLITGVKYAAILAVLAFLITLIPLVGSIISTVIITFVALFTSPSVALITAIVLVAYMQIEAYVLTPRVVGKSVSIPGSLVLIGAMVGATLMGLLGALVAFPIAASILIIIKKVVVPRQNLA